jgi:hypothetical protein
VGGSADQSGVGGTARERFDLVGDISAFFGNKSFVRSRLLLAATYSDWLANIRPIVALCGRRWRHWCPIVNSHH